MPTVTVNGLAMYYEIQGDGPPLVLINGQGSEVTEYGAIVRPLSEHYTVVAFDNRGAGRTEKPDSPYAIPMMADDTAGLMSILGIGPAAVLGISMGGRIALMLTVQHPGLVSRLILASTAARRPYLSRMWPLPHLVSSLPGFRSRYPQPRYAYQRQIFASETFDCTARLPEITVPTLIMHGRRDPIIRYELAQELHAGIRGSELITFNGGHIFMFLKEKPAFLQAVNAFLGTE